MTRRDPRVKRVLPPGPATTAVPCDNRMETGEVTETQSLGISAAATAATAGDIVNRPAFAITDPVSRYLASHLEAVIDCLADHAIVTLNRDGHIASWNRAAQATTGYRASEMIGQHISIFYTAAHRQLLLPWHHLHLAAAHGLHWTEGWRLRKSRDPFWARVALQIVTNADDTIAGFVMVARDVTGQNGVFAWRDAQARSRHVAALARLTGGLVHDAGGAVVPGEPSHDVALLSSKTARHGGHARTVLLVDDDANVLSLVGEMLAYLGYRVLLAQDASEAMQQLRADAGIDCLFADIVMPNGLNGMQLMQAARTARPGLRAALASIRSRDDVQDLGGIPQGVAFFEKPYVISEVSAYLAAE